MITVRNLNVTLGKANILQNVSFAGQPGEVVAVLGPNGAGKSTLLKVLASENTRYSGRVTIDGRTLDDWPPHTLAQRRAVLPQHASLGFPFPVEEVVALGRTPHPQSTDTPDILETVMQMAGITHLAKRNYMTLSGGEQQRTHFARVLAQLYPIAGHAHKLLLLDEPVASLDLKFKHQLLAGARQLAAQGACVLLILHDLSLAQRYADRVLMLKNGELVADGTPAAVLTRERIREVYDFDIGSVSFPQQQPIRHQA